MHQKILVSNIIFNYLVIGMAANKCDLFEKEQVPEAEARKFADEIGATFNLTSALTGGGIDDIFKNIGLKILNPDYNFDNSKQPGKSVKENTIKITQDDANQKKEDKKKKCC